MIALALLLAAQPSEAALRAQVRAAPPAVRAFIERRESCYHWSGEEGYDAARMKEIATALREGRCALIERDERRLRARYPRPAIRRLLDATRDWG